MPSENVRMKFMLPHGKGAFVVLEFKKNTPEGAKVLRDTLLAAGWADASQADLDNFNSAMEAVAGVLNNEEWVKLEGLGAAQKKMVRAILAGEDPCAVKETE